MEQKQIKVKELRYKEDLAMTVIGDLVRFVSGLPEPANPGLVVQRGNVSRFIAYRNGEEIQIKVCVPLECTGIGIRPFEYHSLGSDSFNKYDAMLKGVGQ